MAHRDGHERQPPWQFSQSLGGYYVYQPSADLTILQNGRQFSRPSQIPISSLSNAVYEYTGSPQRSTDAYHLQGQHGRLPQSPGGRSRALQQPAPQYHYPRSQLEQQQHEPRVMGPQGSVQTMVDTHLAPQVTQIPVQTRRIQYNDPRTEVRVLVETSPPERITPPDMLAQGITARQSLLGTQSGDTEKLDPSFFVRPSNFFVFGRVFKILWAEPAGVNTAVTQNMVENRSGNPVFCKVRRFVVIRQTQGAKYCSALPITTYGGKGVGKIGVVKSKHGIIYTGKDIPRLDQLELPGRNEDGIRSIPIRVDPDSALDRLDAMSRINFAAVHTVHHTVKAKSVGIVNTGSLSVLQQHFQNVWISPRAGPARSQPHQPQQQDQDEEEEEADDDGDDDDGNDDGDDDDDDDEEDDEEEEEDDGSDDESDDE
jgi:hypothetical protein